MAADAHITGALTRALTNPDLSCCDTLKLGRRGFFGAMAVLPVIAGSALSASAKIPTSDPRWTALVVDFRAKHAAWLASCHGEDDQMPAYLAALPPEPQSPGSALPDDIHGMTIAEIKAAGDDYRVPTLLHLVEKIEIVMADYEGEPLPREYLDAILADVRRLAGEVRS